MTSQNEAQMNEEFEKWWISIDEDCRWETDKSDHKEPFKSAYSLQQEKIEKLEKELAQQKFNNAHNLSIDQSVADEIMKLNEIINIQGDCLYYYAHKSMGSGGSARDCITTVNKLKGANNVDN